MKKTAYRILAKNMKTNQRITQQFLDGTVITDRDRAWAVAEKFAQKQSARDRTTWLPEIESYEPR